MLFICRQCLFLEEQGIISLWYHHLPSLEEAVLSLLQSVLTNNESSPQKLEQLLEQALLVGHFYCNTTTNVQSLSYEWHSSSPQFQTSKPKMKCILGALCSTLTLFVNGETKHVECKLCSFCWGHVFKYTVLTCVSVLFRWDFIFCLTLSTPFGFAPHVSHIIWLTLPSIAHHLAYMVHALCVTG